MTKELIRRWLNGWTAARSLPEAEPVEPAGDGLRSKCDQPGREVEVFALRADEQPESLVRLAAAVAAARRTTWLTVPTLRPSTVEAVVAAAGLELVHRSEWFMTIDLTEHPQHKPAAPYKREIRTEGPVTVVSLHGPSGDVAARGAIAVVGADAIADRIETDPAHRRRGLGRALMSALADAAVAQGARTGLLIASEEGQRLYSSLGWHHEADVVIARGPVAP
ncbi:GNAT family N-acetyltransferase [Streptomyces virginiae]|uniref:N-acetyltransferase domain-containing protein n=1 Tax=Streptomyces virginiae TaxID=1961 RepID=A0ABQ3NPN0_STRVG|nr:MULTISPECIES: GNAT family N-acetyltransferase [Streptomyces]KOU10869.1 GNAT family acetyltransferase [Streptomyces sp. WM6349]KOV53783.1 GNAT family acetyltransferase [Streptomyces sp. H036]MBP2341406.1 GNAT superfamily N-acetyltransferase [Streptomyces virginiae]MCI4079131.1 GNAT family N-acetyltransferase [Streptomyces sp. MMS21 TC-5]QNE29605.1 GNAT family N-acetyltransferase [Streptomyces sp. INR7]